MRQSNYDCFDGSDEHSFRASNREKRLSHERQRRGNHEWRRINGPEMNHEGHEMCEVLFALQFCRFPDENERREYHKKITKGHGDSLALTKAYEDAVFSHYGIRHARANPASIKWLLAMELNACKMRLKGALDIELLQSRLRQHLPVVLVIRTTECGVADNGLIILKARGISIAEADATDTESSHQSSTSTST